MITPSIHRTVTHLWEAFWRRHPRLLVGTVVVLSAFLTLVFLFQGQPRGVVYEGF